jgi:hypothetical protein
MRPQTPNIRIGNSPLFLHAGPKLKTNVQRRFLAVAASLVVALGVAAPAAGAASPTDAQYCDGGGSSGSDCALVEGTSSSPSDPSGAVGAAQAQDPGLSGQVGQLPFTGWDLFSLVAIALALVAGGIVLSRITSSHGRRT